MKNSKVQSREITISLTEESHYIKVQEFNFDSLNKFHAQFTKLNEDPLIKIIPVIISSYGGQVYSLLGMIDLINTATKPVATVALGAAMSCGSVLLSAGTKGYRYCSPNSDVMIHEASSMERGKSSDLQVNAKETLRLNKKLLRILAENSGIKDIDFFIKEIKKRANTDWYLTANQVKKLGLVDHDFLPSFIAK